MKGNYFNSDTIVPLVKASAQNAQFADGDIIFDWTAFEIPKGGARLIGASITMRHNKVASAVSGLDLVFARDDGTGAAITSIGTPNAILGVANFASTDIIGFLPGANADMVGGGTLASAVTYQTIKGDNHSLVLSNPNVSGKNVGYDKYYIAGLAPSNTDLRSLVALDAAVDVSGNNGTITTLDGTAPNLVFTEGDLLHVSDDIVLGEVASVTADNIVLKFDGSTSTNHSGTYTIPADIAAWRIQNGAGAAGDLATDELVYNVFPIRIILHFEN